MILIRHFILIVFIGLACSACNTPQKQAEKQIDQYLFENLNDYKSLENIEISKLDTLWYWHTLEMKEIELSKQKTIDIYAKEIRTKNVYDAFLNDKELFHILTHKDAPKEVNRIKKLSQEEFNYCQNIVDSIIVLNKKRTLSIDSLKNLPPEFIGFEITHLFRAKNTNGAYVIQKNRYLFNPDLKLIKVETD